MGERLLLLGNGGAALSAARTARASGFEGEIHVVSEADPPAFNPMLGPYYLKGDIPWERCFPFERDFYGSYQVTCSSGSKVEHLDALNQQVLLANGTRLFYDRCLIATGAAPTTPSIPGLRGSANTFVLRTAESAMQLEGAINSFRKAVVLGASFVGLKVAEILRKRRIEVILLDVVDQVLPRGAHPAAATLLEAYFREKGIDVRLDCTMEGMEGARDGVVCRFSDSIIEEADFVVVCTGVHPDIDFVEPGEVDVDQAVLVDDQLRTSAQNLYAAGDVSQGMNVVSGGKEWMGTWRNACLQGRTAGHNMAGEAVVYKGSLQENISPFFEWTYAQIGDVRARDDGVRHIVFGDPREKGYGLLAFEEDVLVGANLINCTGLAGFLRRAVATRAHWSGLESRDDKLTMEQFESFLRSITPLEDRYRRKSLQAQFFKS